MYTVRHHCAIIVCITHYTSIGMYVGNMQIAPCPTIVRENTLTTNSLSHVLPEQEAQGNATRYTNLKVGVDLWYDPN